MGGFGGEPLWMGGFNSSKGAKGNLKRRGGSDPVPAAGI